jgi:hypothetical protein
MFLVDALTRCRHFGRPLEIETESQRSRDNRTMDAGFQCAGCGEWNSTTVDESAGRQQSYVEDCQVCCKPNMLRVQYDASAQEFFITADLE